jgi:hypothetical protein
LQEKKLEPNSPPILALKFIPTIIGFVVAAVVVVHSISNSAEYTNDRCRSNVDLAAQHIERVTQQSVRVVKGVAAWLAVNPHVVFESNRSLLALSPVMNIDPQDSYAIAIIEDDGKAWLLDESYAGISFDVSERPYFETAKAMEVGSIDYGPRSRNINTGQDTIATFYKVLFKEKPIVISTAFSVDQVRSFMFKAVGDSKSTLRLFNEDRLQILASIDEAHADGSNPAGQDLVAISGDAMESNSGWPPSLAVVRCTQLIKDSPFMVEL